MGGGIIQLVASKSQDIYLLNNPQITFFKTVFRRHTNFAKESVLQVCTSKPDYGKIINITLSRTGDLVQEIYLEITLPTLSSGTTYIYGIGNALIKKVQLEIGGHLIDCHYGEWLNIWEELTTKPGHRNGLDEMVGNNPISLQSGILYVPLKFWFNKFAGCVLPLAALYNHEVRLHFEIRENANLVYNTSTEAYIAAPSITSDDFIKIYADYIYLDEEERRIFTQSPLEYLIEQLQFNGNSHYPGNTNANYSGTKLSRTDLNFINPVKEIIWVLIKDTPTGQNRFFNFSNANVNVYTTGKIILNGIDLAGEKNADYFLLLQNYKHHTNIPRTNSSYNQFISSYSFSLFPEEHQPSGYCNFSHLNDSYLQLTYPYLTSDWTLKVYATNYNIFRIMNGMGSLVYTPLK